MPSGDGPADANGPGPGGTEGGDRGGGSFLLLVTVVLVAAGLVLLVIGFVRNSTIPLYLSIACAAVAGVALIVFSRPNRRGAAVAGMVAAGPEPPADEPVGSVELRPPEPAEPGEDSPPG